MGLKPITATYFKEEIMAVFASGYKSLDFFDMRFVNGIYNTDNDKEIEFLSKSAAAKRYGITRIDGKTENGELKGENGEDSGQQTLAQEKADKGQEANDGAVAEGKQYRVNGKFAKKN